MNWYVEEYSNNEKLAQKLWELESKADMVPYKIFQITPILTAFGDVSYCLIYERNG